MLKPLKFPTNAWSPWNARSLFRSPKSPGLAGLMNAGGLFLCASRSMPFAATPALSRPADSPTRGSFVVGSCAGAAEASAPAINNKPPNAARAVRTTRRPRAGRSEVPIPLLSVFESYPYLRWYMASMGEGKTRGPWRLLLAAVAAAAVVLAIVALGGSGDDSGEAESAGAATPNVVQAGAPGEPSRKLSGDELAPAEQPKPTAADVEFVQGMIHHHAQALEMTAYVPERSAGREVRLLAERMEASQQNEIELMEEWLKARGEEVPDAGEHAHGHGGMLMPGMLTEAELAQLEAAGGRRV